MPQFLGVMYMDESQEQGPPDPDLITKMGEFVQEAVNAGVLLATDGLQPSEFGKRIVASGGETRVIDGPFTESKEVIASYALMECKDIDDAVSWVKRFLDVLGEGKCEIRPILRFDDDMMPPGEVERETAMREQMARNFEASKQ